MVKTSVEDTSVRVLDEGSVDDDIEADVVSNVDISVEASVIVLVMEASEVDISVDTVSVAVLDEGSEEENIEDVL